MLPEIREVTVRTRRLDPTEAELWVTVVPREVRPGLGVRGRLVGPRCPYASTVEVAYPLRRLPQHVPGQQGLSMRVVIPEPSFWDPESPFLYQGPVELWEGERLVERTYLTHGLRHFALSPRGAKLNGRSLYFSAVAGTDNSEEGMLRYRRQGRNGLVVPTSPANRPVWDLADRLGFGVIGRLDTRPDSLALAGALRGNPSALAWLLPDASVRNDAGLLSRFHAHVPGGWVGLECDELILPIPAGIHFLVLRGPLSDEVLKVALPLLVYKPFNTDGTDLGLPTREIPGVWGEVVETSR